MGVWDTYAARSALSGMNQREATLIRAKREINVKVRDNLSFTNAEVDGVMRDVAIINTDNLNEKYILSMPDEDLHAGSIVDWFDNKWLITEKDANTTVYTRCKMLQCNYNLKWIDKCGTVHSQWCIIEDGTKYLTGIFEDSHFIVTRGDSRIAMTISRNKDTIAFDRDTRFIVDEENSPEKLAYRLTKPLKVGHVYGDEGIFKFVLQEDVITDEDNTELDIADYYKYYPKIPVYVEPETPVIDTSVVNEKTGKRVWL